MSKTDHNSQAELAVNVIDLAIDCFTDHPPEYFGENDIKQAVSSLLKYKNDVVDPAPEFKNIKSVKQIIHLVLIFFQEGSGETVNAFWNEVNARSLKIKRVYNRFDRILKKGKIKDHEEYDIIIDLYDQYVQTNMPSKDDIEKINDLISNFEKGK